MSKEVKVAIITSNHQRHKYYCQNIAAKLNVVGIVAEGKSSAVSDFSAMPDAEREIIQKHFQQRDAAEKKLLGENAEFPDTEILDIPFSHSNNQDTFDWIQKKDPDFILLYGSGIIKDPLLSYFNDKIVNLHLGLSPFYRGSGTNFWPLVYNEPECVGATIHMAVAKVDAGSILHQVRPDGDANDRAHELGTKTIIKAIEHIPGILEKYIKGLIQPQAQELSLGRVFRNKDFNAQAVQQIWNNFDNGMMMDFLGNYNERCNKYKIVEQ